MYKLKNERKWAGKDTRDNLSSYFILQMNTAEAYCC